MSLKNLLTDLQSYYQDYTFSQKYPASSEYATKPEAIAQNNFKIDVNYKPFMFENIENGEYLQWNKLFNIIQSI